jgi:hypothetical protein
MANNRNTETPTQEEIDAAIAAQKAAAEQAAAQAAADEAAAMAAYEASLQASASGSITEGATESAANGVLVDDVQRAVSDRPESHVRDGKLTREGMEQAIKDGGSVKLQNGRIVSKIEDLPTLAELAAGNPGAEKIAREILEQQKRDIDAQLAKLN